MYEQKGGDSVNGFGRRKRVADIAHLWSIFKA